jgi:phenylpropionate dioxygenase-like ring-hydroxylating dioxygenase large terminal subunit
MSRAVSHWQIAAESRQLRRAPLSVFLDDRYVVLFRAGSGAVGALEDRCAHRNAPLSAGRVCGEHLQCPYHGWEYRTDGRVARIPALGTLEQDARGLGVRHYRAVEQQGFIWVAPAETTLGAPPTFPYLGERGWTTFVMQTRFKATIEACLENFLDCPHATFVHRYWFRSPTARPVRAVVRTLTDGAVVEFFEEPREKSVVWWLLAPRKGSMRHTDRFIAPAMSRVDYEFPSGLHYVISSSCTRRTSTETEVFTVMSFKWGWLGPLVRLYFEPLSRRIIRQDADMLAAQQANIERFGEPRFASTHADLLGRHIVAWRQAIALGMPPPLAGDERAVEIEL